MKKKEIKRILVPVDFSETSEAATANAMLLAKLLKADVFLMHVIEYNWYHLSTITDAPSELPTQLNIKNGVEKRMHDLQNKVSKKYGIIPGIIVTTGSIHTEIIDISEKRKIDLIVMGTHGVSGYNEIFIGSNAQRVVTLSTVPVLTMQKKYTKPNFKNILLPINNAIYSREKVNLAIIIGNLFGAVIHIIGLPETKEKTELNKFDIKIESVEKIVNEAKLSSKTKIVRGENLAKAAMYYATKNKCDLIIINTGHESRFKNIFLGAFAQQIVNHSKIPVLSLKHSESFYSIDAPGFGIE